MKYIVLGLVLYSTVLSVFLVAYFVPIKKVFGRVVGALSFSQQFLLVFALSTIVVVVGFFALLLYLNIKVPESNLGQIGDFIGGILNPILSFLALIAIVISISLQEKELSSSVSSLREQEKIFRIQNFESSFFNLLTIMRTKRGEMTRTLNSKTVKVCQGLASDINSFNKMNHAGSGEGYLSVKKAMNHSKTALDVDAAIELLRQFHMIITSIDNAGLEGEEKKYYLQIFFADIDWDERIVLINASVNYVQLRRVIREYGLSSVAQDYFLCKGFYNYYAS